jgi:hypothetical protein
LLQLGSGKKQRGLLAERITTSLYFHIRRIADAVLHPMLMLDSGKKQKGLLAERIVASTYLYSCVRLANNIFMLTAVLPPLLFCSWTAARSRRGCWLSASPTWSWRQQQARETYGVHALSWQNWRCGTGQAVISH